MMGQLEVMPNFDERLERFVEIMDAKLENYYSKLFPRHARTPIHRQKGKRYMKIFAEGRIFAFIDMTDGNIYKPQTHHRPAMHPRGNIDTDANIEMAFSPDGSHIRYLD